MTSQQQLYEKENNNCISDENHINFFHHLTCILEDLTKFGVTCCGDPSG